MNILESIIDMMLNTWYINIDNLGRIKAIKLSHPSTYHNDSLEFYIVIFFDSDKKIDFTNGFYSTMKINNILEYVPLSEANLSNEALKIFAKELLIGV